MSSNSKFSDMKTSYTNKMSTASPLDNPYSLSFRNLNINSTCLQSAPNGRSDPVPFCGNTAIDERTTDVSSKLQQGLMEFKSPKETNMLNYNYVVAMHPWNIETPAVKDGGWIRGGQNTRQ